MSCHFFLFFIGFLPIATNRYLLPKLHKERSVIYPLAATLQPHTQPPHTQTPSSSSSSSHTSNASTTTITSTPSQSHPPSQTKNHYKCQVHTSKSTRKKSKRYTFTINQSFESVVTGCHNQHGISWLFPPIVQAFRAMNHKTISSPRTTSSTLTSSSTTTSHDDEGGCVANLWEENGQACPVRLYSIEVWNKETGELAAGELGYGLGRMYTSLTGFSQEDSAGSIQLAALGQLLYNCGYDMWDLGMALDYKSNLGAKGMKRGVFVDKVKTLRMKKPDRLLECTEAICCKELIGMDTRI